MMTQVIIEECQELGYSHRDTGTCVTIQGPRFSSRAESNLFRWDMASNHVMR